MATGLKGIDFTDLVAIKSVSYLEIFKKEGMFYGKEESRLVEPDILLSEDR